MWSTHLFSNRDIKSRFWYLLVNPNHFRICFLKRTSSYKKNVNFLSGLHTCNSVTGLNMNKKPLSWVTLQGWRLQPSNEYFTPAVAL